MTATVIDGFRLGVLGGPSDELAVKIAKIEARATVASVTDTDNEITADLIAELLREQHPDLADLPLTLGARGWAVSKALVGLLIGDNGVHGRPDGKATWGPPADAALQRLTATRP